MINLILNIKSIKVFLTTIFIISITTMQSQNPLLIQVDQCIQQLEQFTKLGTWDDANFTNNYKMFIERGEALLTNIKKQDSSVEGLDNRQKTLKKYRTLLNSKGKAQVDIASSTKTSKNGLKGLLNKSKNSVLGLRKKMNPELYNRIEDNGVANQFHKDHVGKIVFGQYSYGKSTSGIGKEFGVNTGFNYYLFLPKAIHNLALDEQETTGDDRWFAKSDNRILFSLYVEDRLIHSWIEISPAAREYNEKSTFFSGRCIDEKPVDVNYTKGFYHYLGKKFIVWHMQPGTYDAKVEAYLYNNTIQDKHKVKIAEGTFKLKATKAELDKFLDERNKLVIVSRTIQNSCGHSMIIEKVRGKYSGEKITYPPGLRTSGAFDTGDKLYVINPNTGQRKFLMTVTDDTKMIAFGCKW